MYLKSNATSKQETFVQQLFHAGCVLLVRYVMRMGYDSRPTNKYEDKTRADDKRK